MEGLTHFSAKCWWKRLIIMIVELIGTGMMTG